MNFEHTPLQVNILPIFVFLCNHYMLSLQHIRIVLYHYKFQLLHNSSPAPEKIHLFGKNLL